MVQLLFTHDFVTFSIVIDNKVTNEFTRSNSENFKYPKHELQLDAAYL